MPKFVDDLKAKAKKNMMPATATKPDPYHALYDLSLTATEGDRVDKPYLAAVASAMYAACMTRGDYAYYTSFLSQFSKLPFLKACGRRSNRCSSASTPRASRSLPTEAR